MCTAARPCGWQEANGSRLASGREEFDRLGGRHRFDIPGVEAKHADAGDELAFELHVAEFGGDDAAVGDLARRGDRQLDYHLALQLGLFAQRPAVERVDRGLVAVEDDLDLLAAAGGAAARTCPARLRAIVSDL